MKHKSYYFVVATLLLGSVFSPLQASVVEVIEQEDGLRASASATVVQVQKGTDSEESGVKETKAPVLQESEKEKAHEDDKEEPKVALTSSSNPTQPISSEQLLIFTSLNKIIELGSAEHSTLKWMKSWVPPYNYQSHFQAVEKIEKRTRKLLKKDPAKLLQSDYEEFRKEAIGTISSDAVEVFASAIVDSAHQMYVRFIMNHENIEEGAPIVLEKLRFFKKIAIMNMTIIGGIEDMRMEFNRQNILAMRESQLRIAKQTESKQEVIQSEPQEGTSAPSSSGVVTQESSVSVGDTDKKPEEVKTDEAQ